MRFASISSVLGFTVVASLANGQTLIGTKSGNAFEFFGTAVISAGFQDADTYADLLVGAPNSGNGAIRCVSWSFLATGAGPSLLW